MSEEILQKEQRITDYIKSLSAIEDAMEPFKEHKRDLRKNYAQNGWLTKDEMRQAVRAYRMLKNGDDINEFSNYFNKLNSNITGV